MIPKVIHYCWFGKGKKSKLIKKCIKSWKKYCPDYQIIEWNEDNFDINCCNYVREAYDAKKWAFVSDYVRYFVLEQFGGIYLDTDVQILKPIDLFLNQSFVGLENNSYIASGLITGCNKHDWRCKEMLYEYSLSQFDKSNLTNDTVCIRETKLFEKYGFHASPNIQFVNDYIIYPSEYFCPKDYKSNKISISDNTYTIHHYSASWWSKEERSYFTTQKNKEIIEKRFGKLGIQLYILILSVKENGIKFLIKRILIKLKIIKE